MTRAVTFDLDGTLVEYDEPWPSFIERAFPAGTPQRAIETFGSTLQDGIATGCSEPLLTAAEAVVSEYDLAVRPGALAEAVRDAEVNATVPRPGALDLVEQLGAARPTALITNGQATLQRRKAAAVGLDNCVDAIIVSSTVGVAKPEAAIFEAAAEQLDASAFVHVGDDRDSDIRGARQAGWEAVGIDRPGDGPAPVARVTDLTRLAALI
ncbi:MAG: HAD family hydrolase [Halobacteriaceae archaeon]